MPLRLIWTPNRAATIRTAPTATVDQPNRSNAPLSTLRGRDRLGRFDDRRGSLHPPPDPPVARSPVPPPGPLGGRGSLPVSSPGSCAGPSSSPNGSAVAGGDPSSPRVGRRRPAEAAGG